MHHSAILENVRMAVRRRQLSHNTEESYSYWIRRFLNAHEDRDPRVLSDQEIASFFTDLAAKRNVSDATQRIALNAVTFFYRDVLDRPLCGAHEVVPRKRNSCPPTVFTRQEVVKVLDHLDGAYRIAAGLLYGAGLRLHECLRLRVKDLDFTRSLLTIRGTDGEILRKTLLPESLHAPLVAHLKQVRRLHLEDLDLAHGQLPADSVKSDTHGCASSWEMQYVFPASHRSTDLATGAQRRLHLDESAIQRAVKRAVRAAGISKSASPHTFRHSFAVHMLDDGHEVETVSRLLGHRSIRTTMMYTQLVRITPRKTRSPLDLAIAEHS
jgi:integron integrase